MLRPGADSGGRARAFRLGSVFQSPLQKLQFQRLLANQPLQGRDPSLILLRRISGGLIFVEDASLASLNPEADQIARDVAALRQADGASRRRETPEPPGA